MRPPADNDPLKNATILVIEDDAMQLMAMQMLLESWGCSVLAAGSAVEAEAHVDESARKPTLIISDFRLPDGVSGIQAVERLRDILQQPVPAILQTGDTDPALAREALEKSYTLLHKPYDPIQLRSLMSTLLAQ